LFRSPRQAGAGPRLARAPLNRLERRADAGEEGPARFVVGIGPRFTGVPLAIQPLVEQVADAGAQAQLVAERIGAAEADQRIRRDLSAGIATELVALVVVATGRLLAIPGHRTLQRQRLGHLPVERRVERVLGDDRQRLAGFLVLRLEHVGEIGAPVQARGQRHLERALETFDNGPRHVLPAKDVGIGVSRVAAANSAADRSAPGLDLVSIVVAEPGDAGDPVVTADLDAQLLVDAGFSIQLVVALQVAAAVSAPAARATAVEQVVGVELVEVRRLVGAGDAGLEDEIATQILGQVERGAPVAADGAVMVEAQARREDGAGTQLDVVLDEQRRNARR